MGYLLIAALLVLAAGLFYEQAMLEKAITRAHYANSAYGYSQIERDLLKAALECQAGGVSRERLVSLRHRVELGPEADSFKWLSLESQSTLWRLLQALSKGVEDWPCELYVGWADQVHPVVIEATDLSNETRGELMAAIRRLRHDTLAGFVVVILLTIASLLAAHKHSRRQRQRIANLESEKAFRNRLLGVVAHELRTPIATISGFAELLDCDSDQSGHLARIKRVAQRLSRSLNTFLDLHQLQSGRPLEIAPQPLDLRHLVTEAVDMTQAQYPHVRFEAVIPPQEVPVLADEDRLLAAVLNLLGNAAKYGPVDEVVRVRLLCEGLRARIEVEDGGPALSPEEVEAVFEPWQRLARHRGLEGYGLGLPVVREVARQHGGEFGWRARGSGQAFWIEIPCANR